MPFLPRYVFKHWAKRLAAGCFDAAGTVIFFPFRSRFSEFQLRKTQKILVIRLDHLGDGIMTRPALRALRDSFPNARIDLLVGSEVKALFQGLGEIDNLIDARWHWFSRKPGTLVEQFREAVELIARFKKERYDALRKRPRTKQRGNSNVL